MPKSEPVTTVLIAEDEPMVAALLEDLLTDVGYKVFVGETLDQATALAEQNAIDVAILDARLGSQESFPLADSLRQRNVPFLFASGHGRDGLPERFGDVSVLQKPYDMKSLKQLLVKMVA